MQNTTFFANLRPILVLKAKKSSPSPIGIGNENVFTLTLDLKRIQSQKSFPVWVKTFSFLFFWSSANFEHKAGLNLSEGLFFDFHLNSDAKVKTVFSEKRFSLVLRLRNSPTHCKFLAIRLPIMLTKCWFKFKR